MNELKKLKVLLLISGTWNIFASFYLQYVANTYEEKLADHRKYESYLKRALLGAGYISTSELYPTIEERLAAFDKMLLDLKQEFVLQGVDFDKEIEDLLRNEITGGL